METSHYHLSNLHDLFKYEMTHAVKDLILQESYLNEWVKQANSLQLKTVLQKYSDLVHQHHRKLQTVISEADMNTFDLSATTLVALIKDTETKLSFCSNHDVTDAILLAGVQLINHYKICRYGTLTAFAKTLEMEDAATVFHEAGVNEKQIDDRLSQLAAFEINDKAKVILDLPA